MHCNDARPITGNSVNEAVCELLPRVAVMTTVCVLLMDPAVTVNVVLAAPAGTVTDVDSASIGLLSVSVTVVLPGAG